MSTRNQRLKEKNKWKTLFYSLLALNIAFIILIAALVFWPGSRGDITLNEENEKNVSSEFFVRTTKKNLNDLINTYLAQLQKGSEHQYQVSLDDDVQLIGELPVFSTTVPLAVHLEPLVQENGDIILKLRSISVGLLELPNKIIMEFMKEYLSMPEWVTIVPNEEAIYLAVTEIKMKSNFHVAVEHIDLEANNLVFKINVPYQSFGID
ncbi:YpmS family protein [Oceanobacillus chungangensis]|uniref:DUF2140 domain-containing protein n=1 Tax=Oceanobacillus chungangensis TaxID=1229152 RepID=A0A3D8PWE3_9BACI|nr:YpmS family protein [Oceanobacillus chungangensis]RDW20470.1 DUF2140 domain-containing protein [Oceanobacillus chungangensis]